MSRRYDKIPRNGIYMLTIKLVRYFFNICDHIWSNIHGLGYAFYGGFDISESDRGISVLAVDRMPGWILWSIGACIASLYNIIKRGGET